MSPRVSLTSNSPLAIAFALTLAASAVVACGGRASTPDDPRETTDPPSASASGDSAALPSDIAFEREGVRCCQTGLGRTCCSAERPENSCEEFRGCTALGGVVTAADICAACCDGLHAVPRISFGDATCVANLPPVDVLGPIAPAARRHPDG